MATEVRVSECLVAAGTTKAAPASFDVSFPPRVVEALQVIVPDGPAGLVGWRLLIGGAVVIPYLSAQWIVTAGEAITWPLEGYPDSGAWSVQAYNTGVNAHTLYFRFLLTYVGTPHPVLPFIPNDQLVDTGADGGA